MCLTLEQRFKTREDLRKNLEKLKIPKIARKDIVVYKSLYKLGKKYYSPYKDFSYQKGFIYENDRFTFEVQKHYGRSWQLTINRGLHASVDRRAATGLAGNTVVKMIIPKGAEYYLGVRGDIVTNKLIWY